MRSLKLTILISLFMPMPLFAQYELDKEIILSKPTPQAREVIQAIEDQTYFRFSYGSTVPLSGKIDLKTTRATVSHILKTIKQQTGILYKVQDDKIILIPPPVKHTISGYVRDAESGENLIGANVYVTPSQQGTFTNAYGYYSLTLPADSVHLVASYAGYGLCQSKFRLQKDTVINVGLQARILTEVVITSTESEPIHELTQMSAVDLSVQQLKSLPALGGETDIMKSLQLLPGVKFGDEGSSGLYVRGGGPDQNLILLDGVPVYNAAHLFGFFSVFNADAINHVELIKGGFPARYGGRLSSVIDISMKEGNKQKIKGEGSVGLITSRITVDGPIKKGKSSFILSGRRTYGDLLIKPFLKESNKVGYYFYDLNTKLNYIFNNRNRVYLSAYNGMDKGFGRQLQTYSDTLTNLTNANSVDEANLRWGNTTAALRWNAVVTPKLFSNLTIIYSRYAFKTFIHNEEHRYYGDGREQHDDGRNLYRSGIEDAGLRSDFDFTPSPSHSMRFGTYAINHFFRPGVTHMRSNDDVTAFGDTNIRTFEFGAYAEDDIVISDRLKVNTGLHFSGLNVERKTFLSLQPRMAMRYCITQNMSLKASYANMAQYIHLLSNAGVGLPTDLWLPATSKVKPQQSAQVAAGLAYVPNKTYEITLEGYHKTMDGLIEYKDGASYISSEKGSWQDKVEIGKGTSYGVELLIQKKLGEATGWIGYTYSKTYREFDNINFGERFFYRYDRRHDVEITFSRKLKKDIDFSSSWVYATGNAITIPTAEYSGASNSGPADYRTVWHYDSRNGHRMRAYHRLDLNLSFRKAKKWGERSWVVSLYNAYSRRNPFYVELGRHPKTHKKSLLEYSLFPIIPSVAYNFKF